jgi:hypothetical protein
MSLDHIADEAVRVFNLHNVLCSRDDDTSRLKHRNGNLFAVAITRACSFAIALFCAMALALIQIVIGIEIVLNLDTRVDAWLVVAKHRVFLLHNLAELVTLDLESDSEIRVDQADAIVVHYNLLTLIIRKHLVTCTVIKVSQTVDQILDGIHALINLL